MTTVVRPVTVAEAAQLFAELDGATVAIAGAGTKAGWGAPGRAPDVELSTLGLAGVLEHNPGDLTAVVAAGTRLADVQAALKSYGQMLALDPPGDPTVGGVVAAADQGPLRHRYGAARDLLLGARFVLTDGTVARSGGKVIKNVAGYDLAKLFCGSFGTLGLIAEVVVRLHPRAPSVSVRAEAPDPARLQRAALALSHAPLEASCLDAAFASGRGAVLARFEGVAATIQAERAARLLASQGLQAEVLSDDDDLWAAQRAGQRAPEGGLAVRVSGLQTTLARVLTEVDRRGGSAVARAGFGTVWATFPASAPPDQVALVQDLRSALVDLRCVVLDAPQEVRAALDPWGRVDPGALALMGALKSRFDPAGVLPSLPGVE